MSQQSCSCIKGNYDFNIDEISCDKILYKDISIWMEGDSYSVPEVYEIEVWDYSTTESKLLNKINVNGFGVTEISKLLSLKDGIYELRVSSCQNAYKRWVAIVPKLQCCLDRYLASENYEEAKHREAQRLLSGTRITALFDQPTQSVQYYKMAKKLIETLNCEC